MQLVLSETVHVEGALLAYLMGWLMLARWIARPGRPWALAALGLFVVAVILGGPWLAVRICSDSYPFAVVAEDGVVLRRGNGPSYAAVEGPAGVVRLHRGVEARVRAARPNGWVQIELANGVVGWIPRRELLQERELLLEPEA